MRQPCDEQHRRVCLIADYLAERCRDRGADRPTEIWRASEIDAQETDSSEGCEGEQREGKEFARDFSARGSHDWNGFRYRRRDWQFDNCFLFARDEFQTSVTYGITIGRLPSSSLK